MKAFLRETLTTLILAAVIFFGIKTVLGNYVIDGPSMQPNFQDKQLLLVSKLAYKFHEPERGDVIVFHPLDDDLHDDFIKRIIGLPGEAVEVREGIVYIHKKDAKVFPLDEPYIADRAGASYKGDTIPEHEYFVLGDNRNNSLDSRVGWLVPRQFIVGKAWLSTWPPDRWGLVANYSFKGE